MKVCVVGAGGREHALAHVLGRTAAEVVVTPGNAGIPGSTPVPAVEIDADLYVIGPEGPLAEGLADRLRGHGKLVFGPGADGARLEGSKAWMKEVLASAGVPTAAHGVFETVAEATEFMSGLAPPYVVKTDGLAAGKGVLVTSSLSEARADVEAKLSGAAFGDAGRRVVVEEGLSGPEISVLCVCDGTRAVALVPAQDYKRLGEGGAGPNTGGMGAYAPVPAADRALVELVLDRAVEPTLAELRRQGIDYRGVLYAGLMLTPDGPRVLEYNVRFGDPEAQVVLGLMTSDLTELLAQAAAGDMRTGPTFGQDAAVTVVLASEGYPSRPRTGDVISGLEALEEPGAARAFWAGVDRDGSGRLVTAGGRVVSVTGTGPDLAAARGRAYATARRITWPGQQSRDDIAAQPLDLIPTSQEPPR